MPAEPISERFRLFTAEELSVLRRGLMIDVKYSPRARPLLAELDEALAAHGEAEGGDDAR